MVKPLQRLPQVGLLHLAGFELEPLADRQVVASSQASRPSSTVEAAPLQLSLSSNAPLSSPPALLPLSLLSFGAAACPVLLLYLVAVLA